MVGKSDSVAYRVDPEEIAIRVELLKAVVEPTRLLVLELLANCGERCHCELEEELAIPANRLSFHLKVLRSSGLVGTRRRGRRVSYHLHPERLDTIRALLPDAVARTGVRSGCCVDECGNSR
jgi:ArsR family transcriptional regulator, arsenate/arsenite/antimonite-responsive transcriptional repressor